MVVLGINPCNEGCTGRINLGILQVARENGHEVYSGIGPYGKRIEKDIPQITIGNKIILRINNLIDNYLGGQKYVAYLSTFLFLKKLKKIKPDIIHIHVVVGNYINLKMLFKYAEANKIKLVWTMHDAWALTGRCAYFELNGCNKWKTGCNNCEYKKQYPVEKIDSSRRNYEYKKKIFADQSCLTIVTPSTWLKKLVDSSPFFTDTQCKVIHNGIDLHTYYHYDRDNIKKLYGLEGKKVIIGVANGWEKRKGLEYMKYLSIHLDENCVVVVVGLDREEEGFRSDTIIISKTTDITEMAKLYSMADVFVNPTLEDNYPTTNLEALACGTPVVTFNTGGSPESIQEGCGIVVKKKDGEELKKAVEKIISMNISPETCVKKAQEFDQEKVFAKYVCLYNSMGESD